MCSPATCRTCGKTTWSGCGRHVTQVMKRVPTAQQCTCTGPPVASAAAEPSGKSRQPGGLRALFRR